MLIMEEKENPVVVLGRLGGKSRSKPKQEAARRNGRLGGRRPSPIRLDSRPIYAKPRDNITIDPSPIELSGVCNALKVIHATL
jgi:hypothetical protein